MGTNGILQTPWQQCLMNVGLGTWPAQPLTQVFLAPHTVSLWSEVAMGSVTLCPRPEAVAPILNHPTSW